MIWEEGEGVGFCCRCRRLGEIVVGDEGDLGVGSRFDSGCPIGFRELFKFRLKFGGLKDSGPKPGGKGGLVSLA